MRSPWYLLAVLNSRVMWWLMSRHFVHMKDEALALDVSYLEQLPIPDAAEELKDYIRAETQELLKLTSAESAHSAELLNRERKINALVEQAFNLSDEERQILLNSLPPRDPLVAIEDEISKGEMRVKPKVGRPQPPVIVAPARQEVKNLHVIAYIILLLRTWNKPVARAALEPAIILMVNDSARSTILSQRRAARAKKRPRQNAEYVVGLDGLLAEMQAGGFISSETTQGQQVFRLGPHAPATDNAPAADVHRVRETLQALEKVGEDRALTELEEIVHDTYELVS